MRDLAESFEQDGDREDADDLGAPQPGAPSQAGSAKSDKTAYLGRS